MISIPLCIDRVIVPKLLDDFSTRRHQALTPTTLHKISRFRDDQSCDCWHEWACAIYRQLYRYPDIPSVRYSFTKRTLRLLLVQLMLIIGSQIQA